MEEVLQKFQHLRIPLEKITSAINLDDDNNCIGVGGFGKVYKGEVTHLKGESMVAIKRLNRKRDQGDAEFLKEITALSRYKHENLISLLGFCYQANERILVYQLASRGSLDEHLGSPDLTWSQRLNICLGVAKGLRHLHDPGETHQRLIHCDVKSGNILLDDQWNAKVADFGFSTMGPANELHSTVINLAAGTLGYCDPHYVMTNTLTKESDVYSFGVVLFEVLCGTLCYTYSNGRVQQILVRTWIKAYEEKKLNDIIFNDPKIQPLDQIALEMFSDIAYRCLKESREDRPNMAAVVTKLETVLGVQELSEGKLPHFIYEEMTKTAEPPLNYSSKAELWKLLSEGVLLKDGKTWFSLNKKGEICEMISLAKCLDPAPNEFDQWSSAYNSRFSVGAYRSKNGIFKTRVKPKFLSPGITYTVNLVFKFILQVDARKCHLISLRYKLQGETKSSISYLAYEREDGWWMCELCQFTGDRRIVNIEILFDGFIDFYKGIKVEGIEFRPFEKPADFENKWSKNSMQWKTKNGAYSISCKGFLIQRSLIQGHQEWFYLDKNGKKCYMLSARGAIWKGTSVKPLSDSRFGEVAHCSSRDFWIFHDIRSQLVSSETTYAAYLVFKLPKDQSQFLAPMLVGGEEYLGSYSKWYIYLVRTQIPNIRPMADLNTRNTLNRLNIKGLPQQRNDGWVEVQIWEFRTATRTERISMGLHLSICVSKTLSGLLIQGVEFRPI